MTLATIDAYGISLFLHIAAVMVGFGSTFALAIAARVATKLDPRHLPYVHELGLALNRYLATPALVIVLVTGLYQVSEDDGRGWSLGDPWLSATFAILIVIGGIMGGYFMPTDRRLRDLAARDLAAAPATGDVTMSEEYGRRARIEGMVGTLVGVLLIVAVFLMVTKPGA